MKIKISGCFTLLLLFALAVSTTARLSHYKKHHHTSQANLRRTLVTPGEPVSVAEARKVLDELEDYAGRLFLQVGNKHGLDGWKTLQNQVSELMLYNYTFEGFTAGIFSEHTTNEAVEFAYHNHIMPFLRKFRELVERNTIPPQTHYWPVYYLA
mmetsp:Transcript_10247/g.11138  ORF Transcript_10247/g.11138 Transcript_10247/m.11138 type:complete len:154 (+) Transcript_10247:347-808(+)